MAPGMMIVKNNSNSNNWSPEHESKNAIETNGYPLRAHSSGRGAALEISLDIHEKYFQFFCNLNNEAFRVTISVPGDELKSSANFFRIQYFEESVISLRPKMTRTSMGLRKYDPNHRKCFFESERKLRFYKTYTQNNCEEECLANYTKHKCGCVRFSQPSKYEQKFNLQFIIISTEYKIS